MELLHRLKNYDAGIDLSMTLRDTSDYKHGVLKKLSSQESESSEVTAMAVEPAAGILAIGSSDGRLRLFGAPPVACTLHVPQGRNAKHLAFSASIRKLICLDTSNAIHIWNVDPQEDVPTYPKLIKTYPMRNSVTGIVTSPSHSQMFILTETGEIIAYDLDRHWLTSYTVPNMWLKHEEKLKLSGITPRNDTTPPTVMDVVIHPRDMNKLFIVYELGVVLWDIAQRASIRVYELILHPGAPGGGSYSEEELFSERRPATTCLSIHPSGHFFAVGHIDGCISFWAVEDDDRPLAVRTLKDPFSLLDVHVPDPLALTEFEGAKTPIPAREPIFKLAWSGFKNSSSDSGFGEFHETALTILGGTSPSEGKGVTILRFPALVVPETQSGSSSQTEGGMEPSIRQALKNTLFLSRGPDIDPECDTPPDKLEAARTRLLENEVVEDFLLLPSKSPHISGSFDPIGILCLSSSTTGAGTSHKDILRAFEYPSAPGTMTSPRLRLPASLLFDFSTPEDVTLGAQVHKINSREQFGQLIQYWVNYGDNGQSILGKRLPTLSAGGAWTNFSGENAPSTKLSKFDYHRLLITHHGDLTVRFYDISPQLLLSNSALKFEYPQILPHLTIELQRALQLLHSKTTSSQESIQVQSVIFAQSSLEVAVVLSSGEVLIYKFKEGGSPTQAYDIPAVDNTRIVSLDPVLTAADRRMDVFHPLCAIRGDIAAAVTSCALSGVGFLAVAYDSDSLIIVDLRGPRIIWADDWAPKEKAKDKMGAVECMNWTISPGLGEELRYGVHLIITHQSGMTRVITLDQNTGTKKWEVIAEHPDAPNVYRSTGLLNPIFSTVLDPLNGNELHPTPMALQKVTTGDLTVLDLNPGKSINNCHSFWVVASRRGARCFMNITGDRVGKVEWPKGAGEALEARVVYRNGYQVLAVFTDSGKALIYSLPQLELLHSIDIFQPAAVDKPDSRIHINCDSEGDFVKLKLVGDHGRTIITLETLFHFRRPLPSLVDFGEPPMAPVEPPPNPVSLSHGGQPGVMGSLGAWVWGTNTQSKTAEEIDSIITGPDRPPPPVAPIRKPKVEIATAETSRAAKRASGPVDGSQRQDLFSRLQSAAAERGEALSQLEERFSSMETSSRNMAEQAKRMAAEQTAKHSVRRWFGGF